MIKTRGERVSPKEIENVLNELPDVLEVAAIGVPDEILGEAIKVFVVVNGTEDLTENAVLFHCKQSLEPFMIPKYIEFRPSLPKLASGKIAKKNCHD